MEGKSPNDALEAFHNQVLGVLEQHVPPKAENPRIRKMIMQRMRRKL